MNSEIFKLKGTFIGKQDLMTVKRIYEKDFNTDLESSMIEHQNKDFVGESVTWFMYLEL